MSMDSNLVRYRSKRKKRGDDQGSQVLEPNRYRARFAFSKRTNPLLTGSELSSNAQRIRYYSRRVSQACRPFKATPSLRLRAAKAIGQPRPRSFIASPYIPDLKALRVQCNTTPPISARRSRLRRTPPG